MATAATPTVPPTDRRWRAHHVTVSYSGAPTGGKLQILSGATVLWDVDVPSTFVSERFELPLRANANEVLSAVLSAGGAAIVGKVNLLFSLEQ